jgi:hypothetical protein
VAGFAANTVAKSRDVPISRAILPGEIDVKDDMGAPSRKRDAILWHVASWGDRRIPIELLQPKSARFANALAASLRLSLSEERPSKITRP